MPQAPELTPDRRHAIEAELRRALAAAARRRSLPGASARGALPGRPIAFTGPLVRALLAGGKTQTRRPVKPQPRHVNGGQPLDEALAPICCHLARVGETMWVREKWARTCDLSAEQQQLARTCPAGNAGFAYAADLHDAVGKGWRPARFMPRHAARLQIVVKLLRVERVAEISEADATREGAPPGQDPVAWFARTWKACYPDGPTAWEADPWVWVLEFEVSRSDANAGA